MLSYFHRLSQVEHLYEAWRKLSKKKHSRGFDQQTIEEFGNQIDHNIRQLSRELRSGRFEFTPLLGCLLEKPDGGKRPLKIPAVRDRVVLKAIHLLIVHKFRRYDLPCSFGYIRRISTADAVRRVRELADEGKVWVLEETSQDFSTQWTVRSLLTDFYGGWAIDRASGKTRVPHTPVLRVRVLTFLLPLFIPHNSTRLILA